MDKNLVIKKTAAHMKELLSGEGSGHDWWHTYRVWNLAKKIGRKEAGDLFTIQLAALLHDIADWKLHGGDETVGPNAARDWLSRLNIDRKSIDEVCEIIATTAFKGARVKTPPMRTLEGKVVQDADRLDAIGAIGIARTFTFMGHKGRPIYEPALKPVLHKSARQYVKADGTTINHFYEKLLLLKGMMNTRTGRKIAKERHEYMEQFLHRFFREWEGKD